jgi:hypothetical protein
MKTTKKAASKKHYVITVEGRVEPATSLALPEIANAIGCRTAEFLRLRQCDIWCDEEALLTGKPINEVATRLYHEAGGAPHLLLHGTVYVSSRMEIHADAIDRLMAIGTLGIFSRKAGV